MATSLPQPPSPSLIISKITFAYPVGNTNRIPYSVQAPLVISPVLILVKTTPDTASLIRTFSLGYLNPPTALQNVTCAALLTLANHPEKEYRRLEQRPLIVAE